MAVLRPGQETTYEGRGRVVDASPRPPDADTVFRIGSVTKTFTGLALLLLCDEGKVSLDDTLESVLPEARGIHYPSASSPRITLRHIVTHTSGLPRLGRVDYANPRHPPTEADLLGELSTVSPTTDAGAQVTYSNLAVALLGPVIARRSGVRFRDYVQRRVLDPLGMRATVWDVERVPPERLATGHDEVDREIPPPLTWKMGAMEAMGGLFSSARDMARFVDFQLRCAMGENPIPAIPGDTVRLSHRPALPGPSTGEFGVNWVISTSARRGRLLGHTGSTTDFATTVLMAPDRRVAVVAMTGCGSATRLEKRAFAALG